MKKWLPIVFICLMLCLGVGLVAQSPANPFTPSFYNGATFSATCTNGNLQYNPTQLLWFACGPNGTWTTFNQLPTYVLTGQTGTVTTTFLTASQKGLYVVNPFVHLISTDKAGTLTNTYTCTNTSSTSAGGITLSTGIDTSTPARMVYMNVGDSCAFTVTAAGVTGTTFSIFAPANFVGAF